ncbi:MAG: hypothetical protein JXA67_17885 [Micromonosporaceae bacterium]|nr:hypothetical protein [Micromonosporaceae bacterium]
MSSPSPATPARTAAATAGRQADSARRRQRVIKALNQATAAGEEIGVTAIARAAAVDRTFLYRHRDLLEQIHAAEAQPATAGAGPAVSRASLQADLLNAQARASRMAARVHQLEKRLSEALGEHAWRESGLGTPADIDALNHRIVTLEQQVVDLRLRLEERDDELAAARAANRQLMTRINTT